MMSFIINQKNKVSCASCWEDVSVSSMLKLKEAKNIIDIWKALTGCELPIPELNLELQVFPLITFVSDPIDWDKIPMPTYIEGMGAPIKNLGHASFGQKIAAQKIIAQAFKGKPTTVDITSFMVELLLVYMPGATREKVEALSFMQCYPVFSHYCNEIIKLVGRDKKFLDQKPDPELTLAGVEKLSKFAEMRIIDTLAAGDLVKYDAILKMEYDVIFKKLWLISEQSALMERLQKIRQQKQAKT